MDIYLSVRIFILKQDSKQ